MGKAVGDRNSPGPPGNAGRGRGSWVPASVTVVLLVGSAVLWGRELLAGRARDQAFKDIQSAAPALNDAGTTDAARRFRSQLPWLGTDDRLGAVEAVERELALWPNLRKRTDSYERLRAALQRSDEGAAREAAEVFLKTGPEEKDPRREQVGYLLDQLQGRARRRSRDGAYTQMVDARKSGQFLPGLLAAERFLEAEPAHDRDPRLTQVLEWYTEAFSKWFVRQPPALDDQAKARVERYRKLTPNS
jgi:hypothetical protein